MVKRRRSYKKPGEATHESIEDAKKARRNRQFAEGSRIFKRGLTSSQRITERDESAQKNFHLTKLPEPVKLPAIVKAKIKSPYLKIRQGAIIEAANREKITGARTVNDLLAISGGFNRIKTLKRANIDIHEKISNLPKVKRELIFNELVNKRRVKEGIKSDIQVTALAKALKLF